MSQIKRLIEPTYTNLQKPTWCSQNLIIFFFGYSPFMFKCLRYKDLYQPFPRLLRGVVYFLIFHTNKVLSLIFIDIKIKIIKILLSNSY